MEMAMMMEVAARESALKRRQKLPLLLEELEAEEFS